MKRIVIEVDPSACTGCGLCTLDCPTLAIEVRDGCSMLVDERCCDGGGACVASCPHGAIALAEREARPFEAGRRRQ
jgi:ferredoxin